MTSPSFWANTFVQVTQNDKSGSDAVAMDVGDDIKKRMQQVVASCNAQVQKLKQHLVDAQRQDAGNKTLIAECQGRIKWCEQEAAKAR